MTCLHCHDQAPLLQVIDATHYYGERKGCADVSFELWPGEVVAIVGESGSGKSTLLSLISGRLPLTSGTVVYRDALGHARNMGSMSEGERRRLLRTEWGFVHQNPRDGLRMRVSAAATSANA